MATLSEQEPNNGYSSANPVNLGDTVLGALSSSTDSDGFKLTLSGGSVLKLDFSPPATSANGWYFSVSVMDAAGKVLASNAYGYGSNDSFSIGIPSTGTYYIFVQSNSSYSSGQYALTLGAGTGTAAGYEIESNNALATANAVTLGQPMKGQLSLGTDVDYYHVVTTTNGMLVVDFSSSKLSPTGTFVVDVYDAAGNLLNEQSPASTLIVPNVTAGDYYVKVKSASGYDGSNYSLTVNSESLSSAKSFNGTVPLSATLSASHDWYAVSLVAGTSYEFAIAGSSSSGGTLANPALTLCYSTGTQLETCDNLPVWSSSLKNATTTPDPQIAFTAPATGTYYLMVSGNGGTGSYTLNEKTDTQSNLLQDLLWLQTNPYARWNSGSPLGTPVSLTYAFLTSTADGETGFVAMSSAQKQTVRDVLAMYASVANITFTETTNESTANLRFGTSAQSGSGGLTYTHVTSSNTYSQNDVFINNSTTTSPASTMTPGGYGYSALIHETGHALGLKHPTSYGLLGSSDPPPFIPPAFDNREFTDMSYLNDPYSTVSNSTPVLIDIAAVQYLYGANTSGMGQARTYSFSNSTAFVSSLLSSGTLDTIDISNQSLPSTIFMTPGCLSSIGISAHDNVAIPWGATVANVIDGPADDFIVGNALDNKFLGFLGNDTINGGGGNNTLVLTATSASLNSAADGQLTNVQTIDASTAPTPVLIDLHRQTENLTIIDGAGNDTLTGGSGTDTAVFPGTYSNAKVSYSSSTNTYAVTTTLGGTDTVSGVEYLQFSDGNVALSNGTITFAPTSSGGPPSVTKAKVFLGSGGDSFAIGSTGTTISGNEGSDTIKITSGVTGVKTDANIERIELSGNLASYKFMVAAGVGEQILNGSGVVVVTIPSLNQTTTLAFTDGSAPLMQTGGSTFSLGGIAISNTTAGAIGATLNASDTSTVGTISGTTKAKVFLGSGGDSFDVDSSGTTIAGSSGTDTVRIVAGVTGTKTDANIERIELAGNLASYKFMVAVGVGEQILNGSGVVVATIPSLNQTTTLAFTDGSAPLMQTGGSTFSLGGIAISNTTAGAIGATLNTADKSTIVTGPSSAAVTINSTSGTVTDGGALVSTTYTITAGNYAATIAGFGSGDILKIGTQSITVLSDANLTDGNKDIQLSDASGTTVTLHLTGLTTAQDGAIFNQASFLSSFPGSVIA